MNKNHKFAISFMLISFLGLMGGILAVKKLIEAPEKKGATSITNFNFSKVKRIVKKKDVAKIKKKQKKIKRKMQALRPKLSSNLTGSNFGMDMGDLADINLDNDLLEDDENLIMDENSVDSRPKIVSRSKIEFPELALTKDISKGIVEIRLLIDKNGDVGQTQIIAANPKGVFEESALASVQNWKFEPATYRGRNVAIWAKQVVRFGE